MEEISTALHAINILLTLGLLYIYAQNYRKMKSKYTVGLVMFAFFFFLQSLMGLYFDTTMAMYKDDVAKQAAMVLEAVKAIGFAVLLKISWE